MALRIPFKHAVIGAFAVLVGCGGGAGGAGTPVPPAKSTSGQTAPASIGFFVPAAASVSQSRQRNTVPSTTQSLEIVVASATSTPLNPQPAPIILNVSTTNCSAVSGGLSCQYTITVPLGNLAFVVVAFAGTNASGAAIAEGSTVATIGSGTNSVNVAMSSVGIYSGVSLDGGRGTVVLDHTANTFSVVDGKNNFAQSGTVTALPNGDLKLVVSSSTDPSTPVGAVVYARELQGSALIYASTGTTTPAVTGQALSGADMGAGGALQGCPTAASSPTVTLADIAGPGWNASPSTAPAYTSGTAAITVSGATATVNFNGNAYSTSGATVKPQTGSQVCANGVYADSSGSTVAFSPDGVITVGNGGGNIQVGDLSEGGFGFANPPSSLNTTAITAGTYDGFLGQFMVSGSTITKQETPVQATPLTSNSMSVCPYTNFEAGSVNTGSCYTLTFGAQTQQPGVILVTVNTGSIVPGIMVAGQVASGKWLLFGTIGGSNLELIQH